jgi:hypothetical protein
MARRKGLDVERSLMIPGFLSAKSIHEISVNPYGLVDVSPDGELFGCLEKTPKRYGFGAWLLERSSLQ